MEGALLKATQTATFTSLRVLVEECGCKEAMRERHEQDVKQAKASKQYFCVVGRAMRVVRRLTAQKKTHCTMKWGFEVDQYAGKGAEC